METKPIKNLWFLAVNGLIAICFGLVLLIFDKEFIPNLMFFMGLLLAVTGAILVGVGVYNFKKDKSIGLMFLQSLISLASGVIILIFPGHSVTIFFLLFGIWAILAGVFQIIILVNIKRNLNNINVVLFDAILMIAFGVVLFFNPSAFSLFFFRALGVVAILLGLVMNYSAMIIRKAVKNAVD
jgi:uncharacterized membrane protein HdeD (DUF308 family)